MKILVTDDAKKLAKMKSEIESAKHKLKKQPIVENFGQDEVRKIADKYAFLQTDYYREYAELLNNFSDWCSTRS